MRAKNTFFPVATLLQSGGRLLSLENPVVMGILNVTPDSFYSSSRVHTEKTLLRQAGHMLEAGAVLLDIGGASTRPSAEPVTITEERRRVLPAIRAVRSHFPDAWLSVDTYHAVIAYEAVQEGADLVNDVSGGLLDRQMLPTVSDMQVPYIAMHMQGTPRDMQQQPTYEQVVEEVLELLKQRLLAARDAGIRDVILDVGFGFGKTLSHNYSLLHRMSDFRMLGCPILAGISRKGMIWKALGITPHEALNGTTAAHMLALENGAALLRAHDVREAVETISIWKHYQS